MEPALVELIAPIAPTMESAGGDYMEYSAHYREYVANVTTYNKAVLEARASPPVAESNSANLGSTREPVVRFAQQVNRQTYVRRSPPPPYAMAFEETDSRDSVASSPVREQTPTEFLSRESTSTGLTTRVNRLATTAPTMNSNPDKSAVLSALRDVMTSDAVDRICDLGRKPKSYRSLGNLREMCLRVRANSPRAKIKLSISDLRMFSGERN